MARWMGCWCKIICSSQGKTGKKGGMGKINSPKFSMRRAGRRQGPPEGRCLSARMGHGWVSRESWLKWSLSQELDGQLISNVPVGELGLWQRRFILHRTHRTHTDLLTGHAWLLLTSSSSVLVACVLLPTLISFSCFSFFPPFFSCHPRSPWLCPRHFLFVSLSFPLLFPPCPHLLSSGMWIGLWSSWFKWVESSSCDLTADSVRLGVFLRLWWETGKWEARKNEVRDGGLGL